MKSDLQFSDWKPWIAREEHDGVDLPGIYALALSEKNLTNTPFAFRREIVYFGMTNAQRGLKGRLRQFENTIRGKEGHGGAQRFRYKHPDYTTLTRALFVSVCVFDCDVTSKKPRDLRIMGEVARFEFECFARYAEKFSELPEFNDKARSLKKQKGTNKSVQTRPTSRPV